jgi:hypothetical protein
MLHSEDGILDFEVRLLMPHNHWPHKLVVNGVQGGPSMSACVVGVPMCCRELLVMVLLG